MDSILDLILDWKAESTNYSLMFPGLPTVHFLITCSLVPKVVIITAVSCTMCQVLDWMLSKFKVTCAGVLSDDLLRDHCGRLPPLEG